MQSDKGNKVSITATIITLNEEGNIQACIESLTPVCDEIIVVDSISSDATVNIAESLGARVFIQSYLGDGPQKAFGVQYAKNDWILSIDADERLDADAVDAIGKLDLDRDDIDAYAFRRRNFVGKHWIRAAGFYPDSVIRLYHKDRAAYLPKKGHSRVDADRVKSLPAHIVHYTYRDYAHWIERINQLSTRDAWAMYEKGKRANILSPVSHALIATLRKYIFKGGFLHGLDGATVTVTTAFHAYMKYLKLLELQRQKQNEESV